jgi:hypothetical protein
MNTPARYITYGSAVAALLGIVACGADRGDRNAPDPADDTSASQTLPACADVWVKGQTLPTDYQGCTTPDGAEAAAMIVECVDGRSWATHEDRFFGYLGGTITEAPAESDAYREAFDKCQMG